MKYVCFECDESQTKSPRCLSCGGSCEIIGRSRSAKMPGSKEERPMTTGAVARLAGLTVCHVWHCIKRGKLRAFQMDERGWHYCWRRDVDAWLERRELRRARLAEKKRNVNE